MFFFAISLIILSAAINRPGVQTAGGDDSGGHRYDCPLAAHLLQICVSGNRVL